MSVTASLTTMGLDSAIARLSRLEGFQMAELADDAGAILESSTRRRFETKTTPDGDAWTPWSEAYDDTRDHDRHSLLVSDGDLHSSIQSYATGSEVHVGSNLVYAAHHHFGGDEIGSGVPARPYLGVSAQDARDIYDLVTERLRDLVQ